MTRRILVTRPEPGCSATAARLAARGFEAVCVPLTRIEPTHRALPDGPFDAVMATSANALRMAGREAAALYGGLPFYAVGPATAAAARQAGFRSIVAGPGSAEALAAEVAASLDKGARLLYLTGRVRLSSAESRLAQAGIYVVAAETYDTVRAELGEGGLADRLGGRPIDAVLLHSRVAAQALSEAARDPQVAALLAGASFPCLSARIAEGLSPSLRTRARVATEPSDEALLALI